MTGEHGVEHHWREAAWHVHCARLQYAEIDDARQCGDWHDAVRVLVESRLCFIDAWTEFLFGVAA